MSGAAAPDDSAQVAPAAEVTLADVPATPETAAATGIALWRVSKAGGEFVTRGLDANGASLFETHLQLHVLDGKVTG